MDYADELLLESRNNVNYSKDYTRKMLCPNRWPLGEKHEWADPVRYEHKKSRRNPQCMAGNDEVEMKVHEDGIWTRISCPVCGYSEHWSIGDGDELF